MKNIYEVVKEGKIETQGTCTESRSNGDEMGEQEASIFSHFTVRLW
jgi:hypothetical protein